MRCPKCKCETQILFLVGSQQLCRECKTRRVGSTVAHVGHGDPEDELNQAEGRDAGIFTRVVAWMAVMVTGTVAVAVGKLRWQYGQFVWWLTHTTICSACKKVLRRPVLPWTKATHLNTSGGYCPDCMEALKRRYDRPLYTAEQAYLEVFKEDGI